MATSQAHIYAQLNPAAASDEDLYTVTASRDCIAVVHWTELAGVSAEVDVAVRLAGAALSNEMYRAKNVPLVAKDTGSTKPIHLSATDVVTVRASTADVAFHIDGVEFVY